MVFDVYKTLIDIKTDESDPSAYEALSGWLASKGVSVRPGGLRQSYKKFTKLAVCANKKPYPDIDIGEVFRKILRKCGSARVTAGLIQETALMFRIVTTKEFALRPGVEQLLKKLHRQARLAVICNGQRLFTVPELERLGVAGYFDYLLFSSDARACKPNPEIFKKALKDMGINPRDAVYIGDDLVNDVAGAKKAGMRAIWVDNAEKVISGTNVVPDAIVRKGCYAEIPEIAAALLG